MNLFLFKHNSRSRAGFQATLALYLTTFDAYKLPSTFLYVELDVGTLCCFTFIQLKVILKMKSSPHNPAAFSIVAQLIIAGFGQSWKIIAGFRQSWNLFYSKALFKPLGEMHFCNKVEIKYRFDMCLSKTLSSPNKWNDQESVRNKEHFIQGIFKNLTNFK